MQNKPNSPVLRHGSSFKDPENIIKISMTSPSSPEKNYIEMLDGPEQNQTHVEKLDRLRQQAPRFANDVKFWPIFDTTVLHKYSFAFSYYYQLSYFVLKLLIIMTILTIIYYIANVVLKTHEKNDARLWLFFGYGTLTIVIVRLFSIREEKKVIRARDSQAEDWTENKFALLVEKLPLEVTKEDIKKFFEDKIQENGFNETIKEIMLLQDCEQYILLDKKVRKENYARRQTIGMQQNLINSIVKLKDEKAEILNAVNNYELYKGKAIIIFETIRGKITIENYFNIGGLKKFFYQIFPSCFGKRYCLMGKILSVKEAPEPSNLIFENLHLSKARIRWGKYLTYFLGNLVVLVGIGIIILVRISHNGDDLTHWPDFPFYIYSAIIVTATLGIYLFTDYLLERLIIHKKKSECELEKVKFRINISYLSINAYLIILMNFVPYFQIFQEQLLLTIVLLAGLIPLRKIFSMISIKKIHLRRRLYREPQLMEKYSEQEIIDIFTNPEFDFANNLEDSVCLLFITLGFYALGQLYFVVISLATFIVGVCIDRFVMIHLASPTKIKGSEMGLEFFRIFRWDVRLQLLTLAFTPTEMVFLVTSMPSALKVVLYALYGVFLLWDFRVSVRKSWKKKWSKERESTTYDEVANNFSHTYRKEYPFGIY